MSISNELYHIIKKWPVHRVFLGFKAINSDCDRLKLVVFFNGNPDSLFNHRVGHCSSESRQKYFKASFNFISGSLILNISGTSFLLCITFINSIESSFDFSNCFLMPVMLSYVFSGRSPHGT